MSRRNKKKDKITNKNKMIKNEIIIFEILKVVKEIIIYRIIR